MKAKVINTLKHDGTLYEKGSTFEGEKDLVEQLIRDGVLRDKDAAEVADEASAEAILANAKVEAEKIIADAKAKATEITDSAKAVAEDVKKAAKEAGDKLVADAKAKATEQK